MASSGGSRQPRRSPIDPDSDSRKPVAARLDAVRPHALAPSVSEASVPPQTDPRAQAARPRLVWALASAAGFAAVLALLLLLDELKLRSSLVTAAGPSLAVAYALVLVTALLAAIV